MLVQSILPWDQALQEVPGDGSWAHYLNKVDS